MRSQQDAKEHTDFPGRCDVADRGKDQGRQHKNVGEGSQNSNPKRFQTVNAPVKTDLLPMMEGERSQDRHTQADGAIGQDKRSKMPDTQCFFIPQGISSNTTSCKDAIEYG